MIATSRTILAVLAALLFALPITAREATPRERAQALFEEYQSRAEAFDLRLVDLYDDGARIVNVRTYPGGAPDRALHLTGLQYKAKLLELMPRAKARGDYSTYSDVSYAAEGDRVRVRCTRFSVLKKYRSPYSILVGPDADGNWRIFEELSESRP